MAKWSADRDRQRVAGGIAAVAPHVILRGLHAGRRLRALHGSLVMEHMTERSADRDRQRIADSIAVVALHIIPRGSRAGRRLCALRGSLVMERMTERSERVAIGAAAAGAGVFHPAGLRAGRRLTGGLRIRMHMGRLQQRGVPQAAALSAIKRQRRLAAAYAAEILLIRAELKAARHVACVLNDNMAVLPADEPAGVAAAAVHSGIELIAVRAAGQINRRHRAAEPDGVLLGPGHACDLHGICTGDAGDIAVRAHGNAGIRKRYGGSGAAELRTVNGAVAAQGMVTAAQDICPAPVIGIRRDRGERRRPPIRCGKILIERVERCFSARDIISFTGTEHLRAHDRCFDRLGRPADEVIVLRVGRGRTRRPRERDGIADITGNVRLRHAVRH